MAEKIEKGAKVVMTFDVTSPEGNETVKKMDIAWTRSQELPTPVSVKFAGFQRA